MCHGRRFSSGNSQWERPSAAAAAEQSSRVVIEPAPLASQPAPDVKVTKEAVAVEAPAMRSDSMKIVVEDISVVSARKTSAAR